MYLTRFEIGAIQGGWLANNPVRPPRPSPPRRLTDDERDAELAEQLTADVAREWLS